MNDIANIKNIAIIGAGTMGYEIAQVALMGGFETVMLNDLKKEIIEKASRKIENGLYKLESKGKLNPDVTVTTLMENLVCTVNLKEAVSSADFIIEAIPEVMKLKQELFKKLGKFSSKGTILATNTSTMSITDIASPSGRADKVIGCHFFTPIVVLRLIEIIKGKETSEDTVDITRKICQKFPALQGKRYLPVLQKESPGFIVNRLTLSTCLYLQWLLEYSMENRIPLEMIDADAESLAEIGPFAKWDYLGLDIIYHTMTYFSTVLSPDFSPGKTLTKLVKEGNLGRKTGKGLFDWKEGKPIISKTKKAGLFDIELFMAIQLNEGCKLLEEGVVNNYKTIDQAIMAGMNIPGPFGAGKRNFEKWSSLLEAFKEKSGFSYLQPCKLMKTGNFIKMRK
ncbi:MAG: 3-hydroxyacyl-CoA dehydrogenase NAD-binding domain-containing protein [Promethearchaeota archaeon]